MITKPGLLARIFGRSQNSVVSKLYTHALGQPLFIHPQIGERLIGAYMEGAIDAPESVAASAGSIAVLNISGGLVNRPMPDICGDGPLSYAAIRAAFDSALADGNVKAIILRMDSPGGMCSGLQDLSDHIYASRGTKPIVAQLDDMAYSACYGLAAACDRVQVTRTSGAGCIGTVTYHVDYSDANAQAGIKVTYIYAGDKKVDGNPDQPLSDSARRDAQAMIDRLYAMFVQSIATYRAMDVQKVIDTQAGCFNGDAIIAAGLADSVGTLEDLIAELSTSEVPQVPVQETVEMADQIEAPTETVAAVLSDSQRASIALAAVTSAVMAAAPKLRSDIAVALLDPKSAVTAETVDARIAHARQVADLCTAAKLNGSEIGYVTRNTPIEAVRAELAAAVADPSPELVTSHPERNATKHSSVQDIYSRRRAAAAGTGKPSRQ